MTFTPDKSLTAKQVEKDVQRQAILFEEECRKGLRLDGNVTFSEFANRWFKDYADIQLKAQTLARYRALMQRINAAIGHLKLDKIQPHHLTGFLNSLKKAGVREDSKYKSKIDLKQLLSRKDITQEKLSKKSGVSLFSIRSAVRGNNITYKTAERISDVLEMNMKDLFVAASNKVLSDRTVHHYHGCISSILSTAVFWQVIPSNPCERVKLPKVVKKEARYLDEEGLEEILELLDSLPEKDNQYCLMIKVLLATGFRRGELCGLKYEDIDFKYNEISVKRNLLYLPDKGVFENTPKTESSIRTITVQEDIMELIAEHKIKQASRQEELGDRWQDSGYIFTSWDGAPLHPDTISAWFRKLVKKYDLPNVSVHSLRHTAATMLLMNGLPMKAVASRLGHVNEIMLGATYSHALKSADVKAAKIMGNVMSVKKKRNKK